MENPLVRSFAVIERGIGRAARRSEPRTADREKNKKTCKPPASDPPRFVRLAVINQMSLFLDRSLHGLLLETRAIFAGEPWRRAALRRRRDSEDLLPHHMLPILPLPPIPTRTICEHKIAREVTTNRAQRADKHGNEYFSIFSERFARSTQGRNYPPSRPLEPERVRWTIKFFFAVSLRWDQSSR